MLPDLLPRSASLNLVVDLFLVGLSHSREITISVLALAARARESRAGAGPRRPAGGHMTLARL